MSDVEVTHREPLTRKQTARTLAALAAALADEGKVELELGSTRMVVHVPGNVECKVEVEIDGDDVEFEVELNWSIAAAPAEPAAPPAKAAAPAANGAGHPARRRKAGAK